MTVRARCHEIVIQKRFKIAMFRQEIARGKKSYSCDQTLLAKGGTGKLRGVLRKGKPGKPQGSGQRTG